MTVQYSIVIPLKDEEGNILPLINEIEPVMNALNSPWELICVDDGSSDKTPEILVMLAKEKKYLKIVTFEHNYGQSSAFDAGFKNAQGKYVITLDGDRQNDPADIPELINAVQGFDLVCGIRQKRRDTWIKRLTSKIANFIRSRTLKDGMKDTGCSLKIYRTEALKTIKMFHGMHRFLPALFKIEGYKINQIPVNHRERVQGQTKYNFLNRSFNTISDLLAVCWMRKRALKYKVKKES